MPCSSIHMIPTGTETFHLWTTEPDFSEFLSASSQGGERGMGINCKWTSGFLLWGWKYSKSDLWFSYLTKLLKVWTVHLKSHFFLFHELYVSFSTFLKLLFKYSCLHVLPTPPPDPSHPHFSPLVLPPFGFVHVSFVHISENPSPFPLIISSHPLLVTVSLFLISMSLVMFCLLVCFVD